MRLHAIVSEESSARRAAEAGATVVQLRMKGAPTEDVIRVGRALAGLTAMLVINDDVEAALRCGAGGVHLGPDDGGVELAVAEGLILGLSVAGRAEAGDAVTRGASYVGVGPVWATPSKADAGEPIGLAGLAAVCAACSLPVVAIGGVNAANAAACLRAGATGVAVIRGARQAAAILAAMDGYG